MQLAPFTRSHATQDYSHAFLFMPGARIWPAVLQVSEIKIARVLGHYLLYNHSLTARCGPTSVTVHALLISHAQIASDSLVP